MNERERGGEREKSEFRIYFHPTLRLTKRNQLNFREKERNFINLCLKRRFFLFLNRKEGRKREKVEVDEEEKSESERERGSK